jgi:hypothetical protein
LATQLEAYSTVLVSVRAADMPRTECVGAAGLEGDKIRHSREDEVPEALAGVPGGRRATSGRTTKSTGRSPVKVMAVQSV